MNWLFVVTCGLSFFKAVFWTTSIQNEENCCLGFAYTIFPPFWDRNKRRTGESRHAQLSIEWSRPSLCILSSGGPSLKPVYVCELVHVPKFISLTRGWGDVAWRQHPTNTELLAPQNTTITAASNLGVQIFITGSIRETWFSALKHAGQRVLMQGFVLV